MRFPLWRRHLRDEELEEEIQAHLEMAKRDRMERGQTAEEAQESARREFGNVGLVKEVTREMWGVRSIETLFQDLRFGVRISLKNKSFTTVAVLSLALGIGANTAIFQLIDALRLRMLPVKAPQELAEVRLADMKGVTGGGTGNRALNPPVTYRIWEQIRERQQAFSSISAW